MKVAHIEPRFSFPGGTERFVFETNESMNKMGVESEVYSSRLNASPEYLSDVLTCVRLARKAVKNGCDSLIFHKGQEAVSFFNRVRTIPFFHEPKYHDLDDHGFLAQGYKRLLVGIAPHSGPIICNSYYTASMLKTMIPEADFRIVYPGTRFEATRLYRSKEEPFCYSHSRLHPRKNQEFLLEVFEELPYDLRLSGGTWDTKFANYQKTLLNRASHMSNVSIHPNVGGEMHRRLLASSSIFLFPAKWEAFGLALLEAMACGKPIVALDSGATAEVLGEAGMLCGQNASQWREAIVRLMTDENLRISISEKSLVRAAHFSWEKTAKELVGILDGI